MAEKKEWAAKCYPFPLFFEKKEATRWKCWEYVLGVAVDHMMKINGKVPMVGFRTFIKDDTSELLGKQDKAMGFLDCVKQEIKVKLGAG